MALDREDPTIVRSLVLMSTISAAADVVCGMAERRRGLDPSAQEDADVARRKLQGAADELDDYLIALRAGRVLRGGAERGGTVRLARTVNETLLLNRIIRLIHVVHQRLLSLYPAVPERLVERARLLEGAFSDARDRVERPALTGLITETETFKSALRAVAAR